MGLTAIQNGDTIIFPDRLELRQLPVKPMKVGSKREKRTHRLRGIVSRIR